MTKDMTTGAITPLLVDFTVPLVLGNLFQLTYNAADSIIVGKFVGEDALAAVGTCISRSRGVASRTQRAEKTSENTVPAMAVVET